MVTGLPTIIYGQGIFSSGFCKIPDGAAPEDGRVIPEAMDTIVYAVQPGSNNPSIWWWLSIIGPVVGGLLATVFGFALTKWRGEKEQIQRRERIASGLLVDVMKTYVIMADFPTLNREHTQEAIYRFVNSIPGKIQIYSRNGLFAAYHADIIILGLGTTMQIVSLYHDLEKLENLLTCIRDRPNQAKEILNAEKPVSVYNLILNIKNQIDEVEEILQSIVDKKERKK